MKEKEQLNTYEWIVVLSLILLMCTITVITHKHWFLSPSRQYSEPHYVYDQKIQVRIEGAVESPGIYSVEKGAKIEDVLVKAKPAVNADLKKLIPTKKVRDGQTIKVPTLELITIYLEGAVKQPGAKLVPKGTEMEDLLSLVEFKKDADLAKLKRKKRLKEGEIVKVQHEKRPL